MGDGELTALVTEFCEEHDTDNVMQTLVLQEEVGEVSEEILKLNGDKFFKESGGGTEQLREELADVGFVLHTIAHEAGIDLRQAVLEKAAENVERPYD